MPGFELIGKEERDAVNEVFDRGGVLFRYGFDAYRNNTFKVRDFEQEFAKKIGVPYAHALSSGTAAVKVALKALGIKPGDEVVTTCFTFVATVEAILECGAKPVLTEINQTLNMDPKDLESKITKKTRAVVVVHMLGAPAQMDEIMSIAKKHKLPVIEDTAQALGGEYRGKKLGTLGTLGTFSFDFGKALTTGEGGMVVTKSEALYLRARAYADHGHEHNPRFPRGEDTRTTSGFNYRMGELQGAIGIAQLGKLDYILETQKGNKKKLKDGIRETKNISFREFADEKGETGDTLVFFVEDEAKAKAFNRALAQRGLGTKLLPEAINWHFAGTWSHIFNNPERKWKKSGKILKRAIALPVYVKMTDEQIQKVVNAVREISSSL